MVDEPSRQKLIFVSYSHHDGGWLEALELTKDQVGPERARFWTDGSGIHPGDDWPEHARAGLQQATAAVLLISENFLRSDAIMKQELPAILERYRSETFAVVFVPIGPLDVDEVAARLQLEQLHNIVSVPAWQKPLPLVPERRPDIREQILSAATETVEVQNLRRNLNPKYHLDLKLPAGALGQVFIATDSQLQRKVCIKLLSHSHLYQDFQAAVRKVATATDHTHALTLYGAYLDAIPAHIVRQYVDGESLRSYLDERGAPVRSSIVQRFLTDVGSAVVHAHRNGVNDLTIKPTNVMITEPRSADRISFMISMNSYREEVFLDDDAWRSSPRKKSIFYLPPEYRWASRDDSDPEKADQYRLGLIAYEMLIGARHFERVAAPLRERVLEQGWQWPALQNENCGGCPEDLRRVVSRMVNTDPRERYHSLSDALREIATDLHVQTARESYRRIMEAEATQQTFFRTFYLKFLAAYPRARQRFFGDLGDLDLPEATSAWKRQFQKLKEAVLLLLVFSALHEEKQEPNILTRIVEDHAAREVPSWMYKKFADMLIECIVEMDTPPEPMTNQQLQRAWERVMEPGVQYMVRRTDEINDARWQRISHSAT